MYRPYYKIAIIGTILTASAAGLAYLHHSRNINHTTYRIDLTETGFSPQNITISRDNTIVFSTSRGKQFWPAV